MSEIDALRARISACYKRIEHNKYLIGRLKPVKGIVAAKKGDFSKVMRLDKKILQEKYEWKGENYRTFQSKGNDLISEDADFQNKTLDHILDSLNNEITRLENENLKEFGLIGWLTAQINSLANTIENAAN